MAEMGKLVCNNATANVIYSANLENGIVDIADFDVEAYQLLTGIDVGEKVTLHKSDGSQLNLFVKTMNIGQHIQCQAVIEK